LDGITATIVVRKAIRDVRGVEPDLAGDAFGFFGHLLHVVPEQQRDALRAAREFAQHRIEHLATQVVPTSSPSIDGTQPNRDQDRRDCESRPSFRRASCSRSDALSGLDVGCGDLESF
jgi:hypothetical protein